MYVLDIFVAPAVGHVFLAGGRSPTTTPVDAMKLGSKWCLEKTKHTKQKENIIHQGLLF